MKHGWIVGLDIGGTFTDAVMVHAGTRRHARFKCLTTPDDPSRGALMGIDGILAEAGAQAQDVSVVLHATTLVSNALIERKGARTALVSTNGFRDVLKIGREKKYDIYDVQLEKPEPLVPDHLCFEVAERIGPDGSIVEPLDERSAADLAQAIRDSGAESVAVCLLHSYMNAAHERRLRELLQRHVPGVMVSLSSDVLPEMREFERASTTAANAFVQPVIDRYLHRFVDRLRAAGMDAALFIMMSEGGIAAPDVVRRLAVRMCESGPAAGAVTAASVARQRKLDRILSFDMGGTTAKTTLIHSGAPEITMDFEVARTYRFKKGSGLPLRVPVVDLMEIGAGGGSIVRIDRLGLVTVGPDSVGADPGPACYGRGGTLPTVTDADVVLGYLGPDSFLGGRMQLDARAAYAAIEEHIAKPLRISVTEAALGIYDIVNENMANASRMQAVERGHDPAAYSLVAFGGAGPVHAWGVAKRLRLATVIVPPSAGLGSAVGLLLAPRTFRIARTHIGALDKLDWRTIESLFGEITREAAAALREAGVAEKQMRFSRSVDMRYRGQRKELSIDLPNASLRTDSARLLRAAFERAYARVYHRTHADHPVETLAWRLAATGPAIRRPGPARSVGARLSWAKSRRRREMLFPGWPSARVCPVFSRDDLVAGARARGPALIEEPESTTVVGPNATVRVDEYGNLVIALPPKDPQ